LEGLDAIQKRIMADAREQADHDLRQAEQTAEQIKERAEQARDDLIKQRRLDAENEMQAMISRAQSLAALDRRKALLKARQKLIQAVLDQTMQYLCDRPGEEKGAFYSELIRKSGQTSGKLVLNETDRALFSLLPDDLKKDFCLADEPGSFSGGLMIQKERIEENLTFETLIENRRQELVSLIADYLFGRASVASPGSDEANSL
jgi:V/A-type H+/Na+-transporting ATPase subunit E